MSSDGGPPYLHHQVFLIRHGETVDNVAGLYAGTRDSALTNHGVQQALRLGQYFANRNVVFTHIFSSDLKRAHKTADSLRQSRSKQLDVVQDQELREQDFGYLEGKHWHERLPGSPASGKDVHDAPRKDEAGLQEVESKESMAKRANKFIDDKLLPILNTALPTDGFVIAIVSHGIMLSNFWRCLLRRQPANTIIVNPELLSLGRPLILEHLGGWNNTGFLELWYQRTNTSAVLENPGNTSLCERSASEASICEGSQVPKVSTDRHGEHHGANITGASTINIGMPISEHLGDAVIKAPSPATCTVDSEIPPVFTISIERINCRDHLQGLKRTGGGVGSSKFDEAQTSINSFFKKQKTTGK